MKEQPDNCWTCCCRAAFTLVEVVASLMLLGTLLVGILVAHRRHTQQIEGARMRLRAVEAADQLLTEWSTAGRWGAAESSGACKDASNLQWRWKVRPVPELVQLGAAVGQLEIVDATSASAEPLLCLEILTSGDAGPPAMASDLR